MLLIKYYSGDLTKENCMGGHVAIMGEIKFLLWGNLKNTTWKA
jgi:hypothetical protein